MSEIPAGYCQCGCGGKPAPRRGRPSLFLHGHNARVEPVTGERNGKWKGGVSKKPDGAGWCRCGCGAPVGPDRNGRIPFYVHGHNPPPDGLEGSKNANWKGGRVVRFGYVLIRMPDHPRASLGYVREHILVAEKALGRPLPEGAVVHHINGQRDDNRPENLVICPDLPYHNLLHKRQRALEACGHADWLSCKFCHEYDDPANLHVPPAGNSAYHNACNAAYQRMKKAEKREDLPHTDRVCHGERVVPSPAVV